ncbi:hypothetical protein [Caballeronia cordobensis]|uniref:hypothetical protein n=1 Tax=Caballeronia cordobensis TaxID=1353886 RepID=UPI00045EE0A9|nr:putative membrane protein [Burkholderia sp. RPE67]
MDDEQNHPLQQVYVDDTGEPRFRANAIVQHLLTHGSIRWDQILRMDFSLADREQIAQMLGYSIERYNELHWISQESFEATLTAAAHAIANSRRNN